MSSVPFFYQNWYLMAPSLSISKDFTAARVTGSSWCSSLDAPEQRVGKGTTPYSRMCD